MSLTSWPLLVLNVDVSAQHPAMGHLPAAGPCGEHSCLGFSMPELHNGTTRAAPVTCT